MNCLINPHLDIIPFERVVNIKNSDGKYPDITRSTLIDILGDYYSIDDSYTVMTRKPGESAIYNRRIGPMSMNNGRTLFPAFGSSFVINGTINSRRFSKRLEDHYFMQLLLFTSYKIFNISDVVELNDGELNTFNLESITSIKTKKAINIFLYGYNDGINVEQLFEYKDKNNFGTTHTYFTILNTGNHKFIIKVHEQNYSKIEKGQVNLNQLYYQVVGIQSYSTRNKYYFFDFDSYQVFNKIREYNIETTSSGDSYNDILTPFYLDVRFEPRRDCTPIADFDLNLKSSRAKLMSVLHG